MKRRTIQDWASIAEITGAVAVVFSLMYVGFEIRQSTKATEAQTRQTDARRRVNLEEIIRSITAN